MTVAMTVITATTSLIASKEDNEEAEENKKRIKGLRDDALLPLKLDSSPPPLRTFMLLYLFSNSIVLSCDCFHAAALTD